ncbi:MAG: GTPase Era [Proteobacteria bacterium]|nr:GTPase Era [Pseudomonadota bacterium]
MTDAFRTGFVAVVGRPNVGKSTLVNRLIGQKVSITSAKAQTTRHLVRGIFTSPTHQYVFVDTPGYQTKHNSALNRVMNRNVTQALAGVDVVLFVVEAARFGEADRVLLQLLPRTRPVVLAINKIDSLKRKDELLPFIDRLSREYEFAAIVPVSATAGDGIDDLLRVAGDHLPEAPPLFDAEAITDRSERFLAAEFLREKLFRRLGAELPYGLTVEIERFEEASGAQGTLRHIHAAVIVERPSQKAIVIGKGGAQLKTIASEARRDMETLFGGKVFLEVWVKVRGGWADDERALRSLGYE